MSSHHSRKWQASGVAIGASALVLVTLSGAFAANPAEEMFKQKVGERIDPAVEFMAILTA